MGLNNKLLKMAARKGACASGCDDLAGMTDRKDMIRLYLDNIDFCLSNDFPGNDVIAAEFGDIINEAGIFLDDEFEVLDLRKIVILGASRGTAAVDGYNISEIFVKHDSTLSVTASGHAFVMIDIFDDTIITVSARDSAKVCVNRYGGMVSSTSESDARVMVREKGKSNY